MDDIRWGGPIGWLSRRRVVLADGSGWRDFQWLLSGRFVSLQWGRACIQDGMMGLPSLQLTTPCHHLQAPANFALTCLTRPLMSFSLNARGNESLPRAVLVSWSFSVRNKL